MTISKSPDRNTFQKNAYIQRCADEGKEPSADYLKMYDTSQRLQSEWAEQPDHSNDLEWDLRTTDWILEKVRNSDGYAQNLYAAMCNNNFQKLDVYQILADKTWSCSWRYAGGIIADMQQKGDYIDWYCSGIRGEISDEEYQEMTKEQQEQYVYQKNNHVAESIVTDEIREDLHKLGWTVTDEEPDTV